ncbi:hypothetical protein [Halosegnis sp.]|uniref:hypothetical protein n=1 Tax=Halosegnis sp. TaxID=2864959 RepID=UPI0035D439EA
MVEWIVADASLRAVGREGAVTLATDGWTPGPPAHPLPYPAETGVAGRLAELYTDTPARLADGPTAGHHRLDSGPHILVAGDAPTVAVRFDGPARVLLDGGARLTFPEPSPVSLGTRSSAPNPGTLHVPPSPAGVAAAVTVAGQRLPAEPARSFAPRRPHPPLLRFDEDASLPDPPESGPVFAVPDDLESVLVAAPLAYYLGARLQVGAEAPVLRVPATGFERAFSRLPALAGETAAALRRVVHLDRAARCVPGESVNRAALSDLGLDPETVGAIPPSVRYATFLDADVDSLPDWHLAAYVDPTYERAQALPALLDRMAVVYPAEASEMEPRDLLASTLDDFYRGVVSITPLAPELGIGERHAWLATGEVVDACKTPQAGYAHARRRRPAGDALEVTVVCNDPAMDAELAVVDAYRERAAVPVDLTIHESLSTDRLAAALERPQDFFHYIGHCEADGLACPDGFLSVDSLASAGPRTFFLNACGSYREGEQLIERGSVAGAVTLEAVLDSQAAAVGTAFGGLVVAGYRVDRALEVARRRVMMGRDYAALGDGSATVAPAADERAVLTADSTSDGFDVRYDPAPGPADHYGDPFGDGVRLRGETACAHLSPSEFADLLAGRTLPVVLDGEFQWAGPLAERLRTDDC